jgi:hypothetical protein
MKIELGRNLSLVILTFFPKVVVNNDSLNDLGCYLYLNFYRNVIIKDLQKRIPKDL